jgi:hypothetical protein
MDALFDIHSKEGGDIDTAIWPVDWLPYSSCNMFFSFPEKHHIKRLTIAVLLVLTG